jgi:hypothetical protein
MMVVTVVRLADENDTVGSDPRCQLVQGERRAYIKSLGCGPILRTQIEREQRRPNQQRDNQQVFIAFRPHDSIILQRSEFVSE